MSSKKVVAIKFTVLNNLSGRNLIVSNHKLSGITLVRDHILPGRVTCQ